MGDLARWGSVGAAFRVYGNDYGIPGGFVGGHAEGVRVEMERTSSKGRLLLDRGVGPFEKRLAERKCGNDDHDDWNR